MHPSLGTCCLAPGSACATAIFRSDEGLRLDPVDACCVPPVQLSRGCRLTPIRLHPPGIAFRKLMKTRDISQKQQGREENFHWSR